MFSNTTEFTRAELTELFGSDSVFLLPEFARGVSTDTRTLIAGNIFIALRGERFDAHDFLDQAVAAGATALLRWAAAEREAWLDAVTNDPLLPGRILPSDYLGQPAWRRRVEVLRDAGRQLRTFKPE